MDRGGKCNNRDFAEGKTKDNKEDTNRAHKEIFNPSFTQRPAEESRCTEQWLSKDSIRSKRR